MSAHGHDEPLPEPKSPLWLPALGAALFLFAAIYWLSASSPSDGKPSDPAAGAAAPAVSASARR